MQWLTKRIQAQRLDVVLDVGPELVGRAAGESPELRRGHAHGAGAFEGVFEADAGFAVQRIGECVQRLGTLHLEHGADLQVVLQIGPDTRQVGQHRDAVLLQQRGWADARELQQLR